MGLDWVEPAKKKIYRRVCIYGTHGIGKTTWASKWPKPLFIRTEDGASHVEVEASPVCETFDQAFGYLIELGGTDDLPYRTLVVDSADWLQKLIWSHLEQKHNVATVSAIDYGKGYAEAAQKFASCLSALDVIRSKGCHIVMVAHAAKTKFESPDGRSWDRYEPKLHRTANEYMQEWVDDLLFADYEVLTKQKEEGFGRRREVGISHDRVLYTQEAPGHVAKTRIPGMPEKISLEFDDYRKYLTE